MQKAHLYEAILLVNRGIDDAIRGLERLKRAKDVGLSAAYFDEKLTLFEMHRALLNGYFCNKLDSSEHEDSLHIGKKYREYHKKNLDEVQVYRDVELLEQRRWMEGKGPKVRVLTEQEQRAYEGLPAPPLPDADRDKPTERDRTRD
jgi:hypothetical protein